MWKKGEDKFEAVLFLDYKSRHKNNEAIKLYVYV